MKHFRNDQNELFSFEDNAPEKYFTNLVPLTEVEFQSLLEAQKPPLTSKDFEFAVQAHLDAEANERGFDNIFTAVSYRGDPDPQFAADALELFNWRSAVWRYCYTQLDLVNTAQRLPPATVQDFINELPKIGV